MFSVTIIVQFPVGHPNCEWIKYNFIETKGLCVIFLNSNAANTWFVSWIQRELSHKSFGLVQMNENWECERKVYISWWAENFLLCLVSLLPAVYLIHSLL